MHMKKQLVLILLAAQAMASQAQTVVIKTNDGGIRNIPAADIKSISFEKQASANVADLAGRWQLTMGNNGTMVGGIYTSGTDVISFTATPAADGSDALDCNTDNLYDRSGNTYPADWRIVVEQNEQGQRRLGWVLSADKPASTKEFQESKEKYLEDGQFYWGFEGDDTGHRYIYLLSENISTQRLEPMTLWSGWSTPDQTIYTFPQNQEIYGVVSLTQPYSGSIGFFEIWASPRIEKLP